MKNRQAACLVVALVKAHVATQTTMAVTPIDAVKLRSRLMAGYDLSEPDADLIVGSALGSLREDAGYEGDPGDVDGFLAHLTARVSKNLKDRSPEEDPVTAYLKAPVVDKERAGALAKDIEMMIEGAGAKAATREVIEPPHRNEYAPLRRDGLNLNKMRGFNLQIEKATNGQIKTGEELFERLIQMDEKNRNLTEALMASNSAGVDAPASAGAAPVQAYVFSSTVVDVKKAIPADRIVASPSFSASTVAKLPITIWRSDPPHPAVPEIDEEYLFDAATLATASFSIENGKNYALVGPTGCGKTTFMEQIAARLGRPFYRIPIDGEMRRREIIGSFKQQTFATGSATVWFDGLLTEAIRYPSIIDLDEFDRADPDLMYAAHQALERKGILILEDSGRYVRMHPSCSVGATANTKGRADGNGLYANVTELSEASRDRFPFWIDHDYLDQDAELELVSRANPAMSREVLGKLVAIAADMRVSFKGGTLRTACSTRQVKATAEFAASMMQIMREPAAMRHAINQVLVARAGDDADSAAIKQIVHQRLPDQQGGGNRP